MRQWGLLRSRTLRRGFAVAGCAVAAAAFAAGARAAGAPVGEPTSAAAFTLGAMISFLWVLVWRARRRRDGVTLLAPAAPNAAGSGPAAETGARAKASLTPGRMNRLQRENRELNAFAAAAAHDLQGPLRKIRLHADLLSRGIADDDRRRVDACLQIIQATAERGQILVARLLELARASDGPLQTAPVMLETVLEEALESLREPIEASGAEVRLGRFDGLFVDADPHLLRQVFLNLIENAVKYRTPDRPLVIEIGVEPAREPGETSGGPRRAVVFVQDNGEGFNDCVAERLFEPFSRFSTAGDATGSGVGLAIVARVAERHGWSVGAHGELGEGARFSITLPLRQSALGGDRAAGSDGARAA